MSRPAHVPNATTAGSGKNMPIRAAKEFELKFPDESITVRKKGPFWACPRCKGRDLTRNELEKHAKSGACKPKSTRVAAQQLHRIGQGVTSQAWHGQNAQELVVLRDRTEGNALFQTLVQRWHADPQGTNPATPRQAESAQVYEGNKFNPRTAIGSSGHARWVIPGGASASWADSDGIQMIARHRADAEDTNDEKHDVLLNASVKPILEPTTISQKGGERAHQRSDTLLLVPTAAADPGPSRLESKVPHTTLLRRPATQCTPPLPTSPKPPYTDRALTRDFRSLSFVDEGPCPPPSASALAPSSNPANTSMPLSPTTHDTSPSLSRRSRRATSVPPPEYPLTPASMRDDTPASEAGAEEEHSALPPVPPTFYYRQSLSYMSLPSPPPPEAVLHSRPASGAVVSLVPTAPDIERLAPSPPLSPELQAFLDTLPKLPRLPALGVFLVERSVDCDAALNVLCGMRHEVLLEDLGEEVEKTFSPLMWQALRNGLRRRRRRLVGA